MQEDSHYYKVIRFYYEQEVGKYFDAESCQGDYTYPQNFNSPEEAHKFSEEMVEDRIRLYANFYTVTERGSTNTLSHVLLEPKNPAEHHNKHLFRYRIQDRRVMDVMELGSGGNENGQHT